MANKAEKKDAEAPEADAQATSETQSAKKAGWWLQRAVGLIRHNLIVAGICGLVLIHLGLFAAWKLRSGPAPLSNEVLLGDFSFESEPLPGNSIRHAAFRLHVSLLEGYAYRGREMLAFRQAKLQQEIEQLLRQAHGADFEDPALTEIKRQVQAIVNKTLGERVVNEVIITDLSLDRVATTPSPVEKPTAVDDGQWKTTTAG